MNKQQNSSRHLSNKQKQQKARRSLTFVHILIAVVAIIECVLLISFTTLSWIETNSSLVIQNGPASTQETTNKKLQIADALTNRIQLNTDNAQPFQDLKKFFSHVKYFEFAKTTTSDGKTFFFPLLNNTYTNTHAFRKGDTTDYNTSYFYFDFVLDNTARTGYTPENRDVYFSPDEFADIFTVSGGSDLSDAQLTAIRNAMRMSITTKSGSAPENTTIYAYKEYSTNTSTRDGAPYSSISASLSSASVNDITTSVSTSRLSDSVYRLENNVVTSKKLFVARKNAETKVSVRIWFEWLDPDFLEAFDFDLNDSFEDVLSQFNTDAFKSLPSVKIGIKFAFETSGNDLRSLYFDDYTFSNKASYNVTHLTDEPDNDDDPDTEYSVWFYAYQPAVTADASSGRPARSAGYFAVQLHADRTNPLYTRWWTNEVTASMMECLMNTSGDYANAAGNGANQYTKSYFCYGNFENKQAIYRWALTAAPAVDSDFTYNAYSYMPNTSYSPASATGSGALRWTDCTGTSIKPGVGQWQDDTEYTVMTLLKFKDMATAVTTENFNRSGASAPNFQIMNDKAESDNHTHYLVFVNNYNSATINNNFNSSVSQTVNIGNSTTTTITATTIEKITAAMFYDDDEQVFKSYVPRYWLTGDAAGNNKGTSFTYSPDGVYAANKATLRWYNATPSSTDSSCYVYTALGYSNLYNSNALTAVGYVPGYYQNSAGYLLGVGTWSDVEELHFSTELIDADLSANYRYFVGISDTTSQGYYAMIPDDAGMTFSAYIPYEYSKTTAQLKFVRFAAAKTTASSAGPTAYWYPDARSTYSTYYPVTVSSTVNASDYTRGYWNLSVLVDGTYENLVYTTLTDGTGASYTPTVTADPNDADNDIVAFPIDNYGLLQYSLDGTNWTTVADDTSNTLNHSLDRYRFYAPAEGCSTVYWKWTPYAGYSSFTATKDGATVTYRAMPATVFEYTHDVSDVESDGVYLVVTEAPDGVITP